MLSMDYRFDAIALAVSQHYKLLRTIVNSSTQIRPLTREESLLADYLADVITRIGGHRLGIYCREKFQNGWSSRDLRSYKIKFVLTRLRDMLKDGSSVKAELLARMNDLVENAETMAGCVADNKRRNKAAKEARARERQSKAAMDSSYEMDLFEYAEAHSSSAASSSESSDASTDSTDSTDSEEPEYTTFLGSTRRRLTQEELDDLENIELDVRLAVHVPPTRKNTEEKTEDRKGKQSKRGRKGVKEPKKSARDRRFERLTKDILQQEYGEQEETPEDFKDTNICEMEMENIDTADIDDTIEPVETTETSI